MSLRASIAVFAALLMAATGVASCGVEFEPDNFCWKCASDDDCGDGWSCSMEGAVGHCVEDDAAADDVGPCGPPQPR